MTELELYKYITDNNIEYHHHEKDKKDDVIIFLYTFQLQGFCDLMSGSIFDDEGIECHLKDGYVAIWMDDICEHYGIELVDVFKNNDL